MGVPSEAPRREPLNIRILPEDRALIDRAARTQGLNRTDFILRASRDLAVEVLLNEVYVELEPDAFDVFSARLDAPPAPDERLRRTMTTPPPWDQA
ncbi:MAG: DUF1778 domain-containing protein [Cellulomonas sp.]|jgi:uncharacterized protein (DUF1778 family)|nr:DUF1778 domain-containing protein [Cellulomonas sp.]